VTESKSKYVSRRRAIIAENRRKEYQNRHTANLRSEANTLNDKPKLHYVRRTHSEIKAEEPITLDPTESNKNLSTTQPAISKIDVYLVSKLRILTLNLILLMKSERIKKNYLRQKFLDLQKN